MPEKLIADPSDASIAVDNVFIAGVESKLITVSQSWAASVLDYTLPLGVPCREIDHRLGFDSVRFKESQGRFGIDEVVKLWNVCTSLAGDPAFGLNFGAQVKPRDLHVVGFLLMTSPNVGEALRNLVKYQAIVSQGGLIGISTSHEYVDVWYQPQPLNTPFSYHQIDAVLSTFVSFIKYLTQTNVIPEYSELTHSVESESRYNYILGSKVCTEGDFNLIRFNQSVLQLPCENACADIFKLHQSYANDVLRAVSAEGAISSAVCSVIYNRFGTGEITKLNVAKELGLSERTMQRRLKESAVSFQYLLDFTRKQSALSLMRNRDHDIVELVLHLGFADTSSFYKAFKRWTGLSVKDYFRK